MKRLDFRGVEQRTMLFRKCFPPPGVVAPFAGQKWSADSGESQDVRAAQGAVVIDQRDPRSLETWLWAVITNPKSF